MENDLIACRFINALRASLLEDAIANAGTIPLLVVANFAHALYLPSLHDNNDENNNNGSLHIRLALVSKAMSRAALDDFLHGPLTYTPTSTPNTENSPQMKSAVQLLLLRDNRTRRDELRFLWFHFQGIPSSLSEEKYFVKRGYLFCIFLLTRYHHLQVYHVKSQESVQFYQEDNLFNLFYLACKYGHLDVAQYLFWRYPMCLRKQFNTWMDDMLGNSPWHVKDWLHATHAADY